MNLVEHIIRKTQTSLLQKKVTFLCNICGSKNRCPSNQISREIPSCESCHSTVRMRGMIHCLSLSLFGKSLSIPDFPENKNLVGFGMSDWTEYAARLSQKLSYKNTFYHQEPKVDILNPPAELKGNCDFIISSDVFEHVLSPVSQAFKNTLELLKPNGVFVFSVPYTLQSDKTVEHFRDLHSFKVERDEAGYVLKNVDANGNRSEYRDLIFHGGEGATLEMRLFSLTSLKAELESAGFRKIKIWDEPYPEFGISWQHKWSLPITAFK